jgi:hypothetical protein
MEDEVPSKCKLMQLLELFNMGLGGEGFLRVWLKD